MKLKFVNPKKLKVLMAVFFGVGLWGIVFGLWLGNFATTSSQSLNYFMIVILGVINLLLGGLGDVEYVRCRSATVIGLSILLGILPLTNVLWDYTADRFGHE